MKCRWCELERIVVSKEHAQPLPISHPTPFRRYRQHPILPNMTLTLTLVRQAARRRR